MKIAMFSDSYLPNIDGVVSTIIAYKGGIEKKGHSYCIFAPDADGQKAEKGVYRFKAIKFPPYPQYRAAIFPYIGADVAKKTGVQLVHSKAMVNMGLAAVSFASRAHLPSMASLETMMPDCVHYLTQNKRAQEAGRKITWGYLKWLYSHFEIVTAPSRHTQSQMAENNIESEVLPSPLDTNFFRPNRNGEKLKRELGLSGKKIVLAVGRMVQEKNYSLILNAAKKMRDPSVAFLLVGKGPHLPELKKEVDRLGLQKRVRFVDSSLERKKLVDYYNAGDTFVFASQFETQGLVQLEAMSCGTPACILQDTAPAEVIEEGKSGFLFSSDPSDCAEKLAECIERKRELSPKARKAALKYSIPVLTDRLLEKYRRLLEMRGK